MSTKRTGAVVLVVVAALLGCEQVGVSDTAPPPINGGAVSLPIRRVVTDELFVTYPGIAVIRDSAHWAELWRRAGRSHALGGVATHGAPAPDTLRDGARIDFRKHAVIAFGAGGFSGCSNRAAYIRRLDRVHDSVVVSVDIPRAVQETGPCDMVVAPVDVVLIPAASRYVLVWDASGRAFLPLDSQLWQRSPSFAEVEAAPKNLFYAYRMRLAEDGTATRADLRQLAMTLDHDVSRPVAMVLLQNPAVRADSSILQVLAQLQGHSGDQPYEDVVRIARQLLRR